jgi:uncharacterized membrane protein
MEPMDPQPPVPVQSSTGLAPNVGGALAYLLGPITGIIFFVLEKNNRFIRFHAAQSIGIFVVFFIFSMVLMVVSAIFATIPVIGWIIGIVLFLFSLLLSFGGLLLWLFLMYKAYSNEEWEFPWIGQQSRKVLLRG